jgi:hypothetical protein
MGEDRKRDVMRKIKYPGTRHDVILRMLSKAEFWEAIYGANDHFEALGIDIRHISSEIYETELTFQILARALRDPDDPEEPYSSSADEFRQLSTSDEVAALAEEYNKFGVWWDNLAAFVEQKDGVKFFH